MRKGLVLLFVAAAACSGDRESIFEPPSDASATVMPATATVELDGVTYEYGCPDFPCPVLDIVTQHINSGTWFWLPDGTFRHRAIYLVVLRVPVQMRRVTSPVLIIPPSLTGPTDVLGEFTDDFLVCSGIDLDLVNPDNGPWDFAAGTITFHYVEFDSGSGTWEPTGDSDEVTISASEWQALLAGSFDLVPPQSEREYVAEIAIDLRRGTTVEGVVHSVLCHDELPPEEPPPPSVDGPEQILGTRSPPDRYLICSGVDLELVSPDNGPWDFVSGSQLLEFYAWNPVTRMFVNTGQTTLTTLSANDWQSLLAGTYAINPGAFTGPYLTTFTATLSRGSFQATVSHSVQCGGSDFLEILGISAG